MARRGRPKTSGDQRASKGVSSIYRPQFARILDVDGAKVPYFDQTVWAGIATLNGLPATIAPIDRTAHGLPIGAQIIGGFLDDRTTIAFAGLIEREFGGFTPPPGF